MMTLRELLISKRQKREEREALLECLAIACAKGSIPFWQYKLIAEWLGVYTFIPFNERRILPQMKRYVFEMVGTKDSRTAMMEACMACDLMQTTLTIEQQDRILKRIS